MKFIRIAVLLFLFSPIHAQIADLLKNDSITWVAEWDADYLIDDFDATDTILNNGLSVIKYLQKDEDKFYELKSFFSGCLWDAIKTGKINVFSDYDFKKVIKNDGVFYLGRARRWFNDEPDLDPTTYQTGCFIPFPHSPKDVKFYRTHQIIYYNAPKAQFQLHILAIAPLVKSYSETTKEESLEPLFWFKPEMSKPNLSSDDIVWAQKVVTKNNSLDFNKAKVLKGSTSDTIVNHFLQSFENQIDIPFWNLVNDDYNWRFEKIDIQKRKTWLHRIDTILIGNTSQEADTFSDFNGGSSKKPKNDKTTVEQTHYTAKEIKSLRLYQEWLWDDKQNKLFIHLKRVAPMVAIKNEYGEFSYDNPLFYRKTDD